jgi:hypothetical protein
MEEVTYKIDDSKEEVKEIESKNIFIPQRLETESFADYKERRLVANYKLHQMAQGKLIWDSRKQGTYRK